MKKLSSWGFCLARTLLLVASALGSLEVHDSRQGGSIVDRSQEFEVLYLIEERIATIDLGSYSLDISLPKNDKLFTIAEGTANTVNSFNDTVSVSISISATCVSCYLTGTAVVTTTGIKTDQSLLGDIISFLEDPIGAIVSALDLDLEVNLENLVGHFEFDIAFAISGSYTLQIFKTETPVGIQLDDENKVGILFTLELIITVTGQLDFTMGFDISFPKGASFIMNPLTGHIVSMNLGGAKVTQIPVTFKSGSACVTAILRLKFSAGLSVEEFGYGFDFEAGVYWDPIQYKACVTYEPSAPCEIEYTEYFYEEIAAYAKAVEQIDYTKWGVAPTAVATYITATLPSVCLESSSHKAILDSTTISIKTTPPALPDKSSSTQPPAPHSTPPTTHPKPSTVTSSIIRHSSSSSSSPSNTKSTTSTHKPSLSSGTYKKSSTEPDGSSSHSSDTKGSQTSSPTDTRKTNSKTSSQSESSSGGVYHQHSAASSSGPPFGNYSMTMATSPPVTNTETSTTVTDTNTNTGPVETAAGSTSTGSSAAATTSGESSSIIILSESSPRLTTTGSSAPPSTAESTSTATGLNTITVSTTSIYTVTSCFALVHICPTSLQSELTLTKTIIQYTTICPATQTEFPSAVTSSAAPSAAASSAVASTPPMLVSLTPCETPIISTIETETSSITGISIAVYSPSVTPSLPSSPVFIGTETLPGAIAAPSSSAASSTPFPSAAATTSSILPSAPFISAAASASTSSSSSSGFAGVIYSVGGFATPSSNPSTTMVASEINGQTTSTPTPTSTSSNGQPLDVFQQGSGGVSSFTITLTRWQAWLWIVIFVVNLWTLGL